MQEKNLRISDETFFFELLRDVGRIVGRLEARVTGPMAASRTRTWEFDPGIEALNAPYTMAAMAYFAQLGIADDARYEVLNVEVNKTWNWNRGEAKGNGFGSTSVDLARALRRNPHLRVLVASGRYDLGTPYSASDWSLAQLDAPPDVLERVTHRYYDAGHMMYTRSSRPPAAEGRPRRLDRLRPLPRPGLHAGPLRRRSPVRRDWLRPASAVAVALAHRLASLLDVGGRTRWS